MNVGICFVPLGKRASSSVCILRRSLSVVYNLSWQVHLAGTDEYWNLLRLPGQESLHFRLCTLELAFSGLQLVLARKISEYCIKLASVSEFFCLTFLAQPLFVAASPEPKAFPSPSFACLPGMQSASQPTVLLTAGCPNPRGLPLRSKPSSPFPLKPHPSKPRPLNP